MSYNIEKNYIDSEEESIAHLNPSYYRLGGCFPSSNQLFGPDVNMPNLNEIKDIFPIQKEKDYNKEQSLINKNRDNDILQNKSEIFQIDKKESQLNAIIDKSKNYQLKEIANQEKTNKALFSIIDNYNIKKYKSNDKRDNIDNSLNIIKSGIDKPKIKHNKFSDDYLRIKCKFIVLSYVKDFINEKLASIYKSDSFQGIKAKKLMSLNKKQVSNTKISDNKIFLEKTLAEIFSEPISSRYSNFPKNKNEILIKELINEKDEEKRIYFNKLFNLSFKECIEHFANKKSIEILKGLITFEQMKNNPIEKRKKHINITDDSYLEHLEYYFKNYEIILSWKYPRKREKKKTENNSHNLV